MTPPLTRASLATAVPADVLRQVRRIEVRTRRLVDSRFAGEYRSLFKGQGMEFSEVREYQDGDEVRSIDWNVSARMGRPFVKRYVEERELTIMLAIDLSGSARFGTRERFKHDLAIETVQEAIRLSPRDLLMVIWRVVEGWAHLGAERFDQAVASARLAVGWNAAFADAHAILASALGHAGRIDEARVALNECERQFPGLTLRDPRLTRPFRRKADEERFLDGLRKAGLAET